MTVGEVAGPLDPTGVRRLEIDGVPVFWLPDGRRSVVALQFRVGRSDEPFPLMGSTHLVEHLAFFRLNAMRDHSNGFVDNIRTVFSAHGTPDELRSFVHGIVDAIHHLPMDRLADESRILRTEAMRRTASLWDQLAWYRYGAVRHGTVGLVEYGLGSVSADDLRAWASDWFTAGNAALWIAGPMPDGLRIELPPGERRPVPRSEPLADLTLPAWATNHIPGIVMGIVVPRETAPAMGGRILTRRLEQHLRYELGKSYEVSIAYQPLDAVEGQASIFASCLEEDAEKVRAAFLGVVDQFAASGPSDAELEDDRNGFRRHLDDPDAGYADLDRAVHNELLGNPQDGRFVLLREMEEATTEAVRDSMRLALDEALLLGPLSEPPGGQSSRHWHQYPVWSSSAVEGRRLDPVSRRYPWSPRTEVLVVGGAGVSWVDAVGRALTVRYEDCVGLVVDANGARTIFGRDGFRVVVDPQYWRNGPEAAAELDRRVPAKLTVRLPA